MSAHHREPLARLLDWSMTELEEALNGNSTDRPLDHGWWSNYVTLEQSATSVRTWEPMLVPGLLQTSSYAGALLDNDDLVAQRLSRQSMVTRRDNAVHLVAVIDESVLCRPIGGIDVLVRQLRHLVAMSERQNVTIHLLPFGAAAGSIALGALGALIILGFPWSGGLVYLEHRGGATYLDSPHDIDAHAAAFDRLREKALPPRESVALITNKAKELET